MAYHLLTPSVVSWNAAVSACDKGVLWEGALGLLQEIMLQMLTNSLVSLNAVISGCDKGIQ